MSDRRQDIVKVASGLFAARGVRQTTVREIGAGANILSGSLYHHFGSKLDIVDEILRDFTTEVLAKYRDIAADKVEPDEQIRMMARYAFSLIADEADTMTILQDDFVDLTKDPETKDARFEYLIEFNNEVEKRWLDAIRRGVKSGVFRADLDPKIFYRFMRDAMLGATKWYEQAKGITGEELADTLVDTMMNGVLIRR